MWRCTRKIGSRYYHQNYSRDEQAGGTENGVIRDLAASSVRLDRLLLFACIIGRMAREMGGWARPFLVGYQKFGVPTAWKFCSILAFEVLSQILLSFALRVSISSYQGLREYTWAF